MCLSACGKLWGRLIFDVCLCCVVLQVRGRDPNAGDEGVHQGGDS